MLLPSGQRYATRRVRRRGGGARAQLQGQPAHLPVKRADLVPQPSDVGSRRKVHEVPHRRGGRADALPDGLADLGTQSESEVEGSPLCTTSVTVGVTALSTLS